MFLQVPLEFFYSSAFVTELIMDTRVKNQGRYNMCTPQWVIHSPVSGHRNLSLSFLIFSFSKDHIRSLWATGASILISNLLTSWGDGRVEKRKKKYHKIHEILIWTVDFPICRSFVISQILYIRVKYQFQSKWRRQMTWGHKQGPPHPLQLSLRPSQSLTVLFASPFFKNVNSTNIF